MNIRCIACDNKYKHDIGTCNLMHYYKNNYCIIKRNTISLPILNRVKKIRKRNTKMHIWKINKLINKKVRKIKEKLTFQLDYFGNYNNLS